MNSIKNNVRETMDISILADLLGRKASSEKVYEKRTGFLKSRPRRFMDGLAYDDWVMQSDDEDS